MAGAAPGQALAETRPNYDDNNGAMTPPRRPQVEPAGGGGAISISLINSIASQMREEMLGARSDLEAKFDAMKREFEIKMAGRPGMGFCESGSIETLKEEMIYRKQETTHLLEKNVIIEQKVMDLEKNTENIKDIKELIENDEKITDMIKKYKEIIKDDTLNIEKLKEDLDKGLLEMSKAIETVRQNTEDYIMEIKKNNDINDVKNKVDEIVSRMNNVNQKVKNHNVHPQSLIKFHEDKIEDKFEDQFEKLFTKKQKKIMNNPGKEKNGNKIMNIADEENNNDDTGGGEQNSVRNTCWSPGGQLPTMQKKHADYDYDDTKDKSETIARLPQSIPEREVFVVRHTR